MTDVQIGVFCKLPSEGQSAAPGTTAGYIWDPVALPQIRWPQTTVPASIGISFGIVARAKEKSFEVEVRVSHPEFPGKDRLQEIWTGSFSTIGASASVYSFDYPYEVVPGDWRIEIIAQDNGEVILSQDFIVLPAEDLPEIVDACASGPLQMTAASVIAPFRSPG
ncbi:DUF3859 domain-containing protein [Paracoccus sp. M683]|uniref:DUF3859 domain-containing protein n=1 Tax=Paracoccus sp. M683 TaxID=2594268 RepID=UPI00163DCF29|nr:DUF3859 domain-containing protein [Paracoccus sp. M683]